MSKFGSGSINYVNITQVDFYANARDPGGSEYDPTSTSGDAGVMWLGPGGNVLFEDCRFRYFRAGLSIEVDSNGRPQNILIRKCVIMNSYGIEAVAHSQGIYIHGTDGIVIEQCVLDHNGWNERVLGANRTKFNHNIYIQSDNTNVVVRGNLIFRASSHGLQLRPGGTAEDNLFVRNAIAMFTARAPSIVRNNVVLQSNDLSSTDERGWGIGVLTCQNALVESNVIAHKQSLGLSSPFDISHTDYTLTSYVVTVKNNVVFDWPAANNKLVTVAANAAVDDLLVESNSINGIRDNGASVAFVDPYRTIESYYASLGRTGTFEDFIAEACDQAFDWLPEYSATTVNKYIRDGFQTLP